MVFGFSDVLGGFCKNSQITLELTAFVCTQCSALKFGKKCNFLGGGVIFLSETNSIESLENFLRAIRLHPLSCRPK